MKKNALLLLFSFLLLMSCKKSAEGGNALLEQYFENNILNRNFIVSLATDNSTNLTPNYNGYIFVLLKTDFYHGPLKATKNNIVYEGTWSSNDDYSKLTIKLPATPSEFGFLTRDWRFTSKSLPVLKLAPWYTRDPQVLNMTRQ
ncbi:MAG: hypothetical protein ABIR03_01125 [Ginsengibacter sp.]